MPTLPAFICVKGITIPISRVKSRRDVNGRTPEPPLGAGSLAGRGPDPRPSVGPAGALEDLERALALSGGRGRAARQSFVQRGLVARLQGRDDDARGDFERAARLGSPFARRQLVLLNPYAALCNRMLADMMGQLRGPRDRR